MRVRVHEDRAHAGGREAQRVEFLAVVGRVAQREVHVAGQRAPVPAVRGRQPEQLRVVGREEVGRRDVVVLEDAPARQRGEGAGHRGRQGEVEDRDVAAPCRRIRPRPDLAPQVVVDGHREEVRGVAQAAQQVANLARAVADGVAAVRRWHPLVDDHRLGPPWAGASLGTAPGLPRRGLRQGLEGRRALDAQLLEPVLPRVLVPEVERDPGMIRRRRVRHVLHEAEQRAPRSPCRAAAARAASCAATSGLPERASLTSASMIGRRGRGPCPRRARRRRPSWPEPPLRRSATTGTCL